MCDDGRAGVKRTARRVARLLLVFSRGAVRLVRRMGAGGSMYSADHGQVPTSGHSMGSLNGYGRPVNAKTTAPMSESSRPPVADRPTRNTACCPDHQASRNPAPADVNVYGVSQIQSVATNGRPSCNQPDRVKGTSVPGSRSASSSTSTIVDLLYLSDRSMIPSPSSS